MHFFFFSVCCIVFICSWQLMFDKKQKSSVKRIHLVTDDGLYNRKAFYTVKIVFFFLIHPQYISKQYFKYTSYLVEVFLKNSSISIGKNTNKILQDLWSNGLMVRAQVYLTKDLRFKTIKWLKNCLSLSSFKGQSNECQGFLGDSVVKSSLWLCSLQTIEP